MRLPKVVRVALRWAFALILIPVFAIVFMPEAAEVG
jgi:hypothetical protein